MFCVLYDVYHIIDFQAVIVQICLGSMSEAPKYDTRSPAFKAKAWKLMARLTSPKTGSVDSMFSCGYDHHQDYNPKNGPPAMLTPDKLVYTKKQDSYISR